MLRPLASSNRLFSSITNPLPAIYIRGGTSKGIFLNRADLPNEESRWPPIFLGLMGSPDPKHGRQLNGMGGGISSLSKICVVGSPAPAQRETGIDVVYTFVQVGIHDDVIDTSGNCGNLSSMVGVYAVNEGICAPRVVSSPCADHDLATVISFNSNTSKLISTTFPVSPAALGNAVPILDLPQTEIAGVPGLASRIVLDFLSPSGARTGHLLPTGRPTDLVTIPALRDPIRLSLVDATNPAIFVSSSELRLLEPNLALPSAETYTILETLRRKGAEMMGLDPAQGHPKIAVLSDPQPSSSDSGVDIVIHALSMGILHRAVPLTVGLCLGVAARVPGTLAWDIMSRSRSKRSRQARDGLVRMQHPSGITEVGSEIVGDEVKSATVVRTGKQLMKGVVWW